MLCRTEIGIEGGLCMATRASLNIQSTILNETNKVSTIDGRQVTRGLNANEDGCRVSFTHTYLGHVNCGV